MNICSRGRDRMVDGCNYATSAYYHWCCDTILMTPNQIRVCFLNYLLYNMVSKKNIRKLFKLTVYKQALSSIYLTFIIPVLKYAWQVWEK
jgi:hypothetical protein